jgi:hypothetical protein
MQSWLLTSYENREKNIKTSFFHEWIIFNSKKNEVTFSDAAKESLTEKIVQLQNEFNVEAETITTIPETAELSATTITKVVETMKNEGKGKKALRRFKDNVTRILQSKGRGKKIKEAQGSVEKKIRKYASYPRIEIYIEYLDDGKMKSIEWLPMTVWPDSNASDMVKGFNIFLGFQKLIHERKK